MKQNTITARYYAGECKRGRMSMPSVKTGNRSGDYQSPLETQPSAPSKAPRETKINHNEIQCRDVQFVAVKVLFYSMPQNALSTPSCSRTRASSGAGDSTLAIDNRLLCTQLDTGLRQYYKGLSVFLRIVISQLFRDVSASVMDARVREHDGLLSDDGCFVPLLGFFHSHTSASLKVSANEGD